MRRYRTIFLSSSIVGLRYLASVIFIRYDECTSNMTHRLTKRHGQLKELEKLGPKLKGIGNNPSIRLKEIN